MLHQHVDVDELVEQAKKSLTVKNDPHIHSIAYAARDGVADLPKYTLPVDGTGSEVAYRIIHDELELDGRPTMNCASFVTTWVEPFCEKLVSENLMKNFVDQDEYPATQEVHTRCLSMIADLWKAPNIKKGRAIGTSVTGSSEGVMLAGLALKWRWREARRAQGKDTSKPNIIFGCNAQVALEKFARYFDVESRLVPVSKESEYCLDPEKAIEMIDENTIGIFAILGSTYTGHYEPVGRLNDLLDDLQQRTGLDIPIHVDGASGAFVAPFTAPDLRWNFELPRVVSINASGHKYGLACPGLGWVLWRGEEYLPKSLIFELHYLGGAEYTYTLNFSHSACFVITQYYNFLRLGFQGYTRIMETCLHNARLLSRALEATGYFQLYSCCHISSTNEKGEEHFREALPLAAFSISDSLRKEYGGITEDEISTLLRARGWIVPAYELPHACENIKILRVVVRESMTEELVCRLVTDIMWAVDTLKKRTGSTSNSQANKTTSHPHPGAMKRSKSLYARPC